MKEKQNYLWFFFLLIIGLTFYPFFKVGFTTSDDLIYYMSMLEGNVLKDAIWEAQVGGRFFLLFTKPVHLLTYATDNFIVIKILQYGFLLLSFGLFAVVLNKIFKQKEFALLVFLLLFVCLAIGPNLHIAILAYPVFFSLSFSIFFISILLLLKYIETNKYKFLIFSAIAYFLTMLFYETYMVFLLFIGVFLLVRNIKNFGKKIFVSRTFYKEILPFVAVAVIYMVAYFGYRAIVQRESGYYAGSSFADDFSISNFFKVLWNYNKAAFPSFMYKNYHYMMEPNSLLEEGARKSFWHVLFNAQAATVVNAILQCFVMVILFLKMKPGISWKKLGIGALVAILFTFSAHILIASSAKYNSDNWNWYPGYVTTYYSYFSIMLLIAIIMFAIFKISYRIKWLRYIIIAVFAVFIFRISLTTGYANEHFSRYWEHSQNRFKVVDELLKKGSFDQIPENALVYAADLHNMPPIQAGAVIYDSFSFKNYIYYKTKKEINMYRNPYELMQKLQEDPTQEVYYITKYETQKSMDMLVVFSKLNNNSINFEDHGNPFSNSTSNHAFVHYYSINKDFVFELSIPENTQDTIKLLVNNEHENYGHTGLNALRIHNYEIYAPISSFEISSNEPFSVKNFMISNLGPVIEKINYTH